MHGFGDIKIWDREIEALILAFLGSVYVNYAEAALGM